MTRPIRVKVDGLREIANALHTQLPAATSKNVMQRVLKKRAKPIAATAEAQVAVKTGDLKKSITVSTKLTKRQRRQHKKMHRDEVDVFVGPGSDPAGHLQEFGSSKHPAQPFMRPAWDAHESTLLEGIGEDMWAEIEKASARLARKAAKAAKG